MHACRRIRKKRSAITGLKAVQTHVDRSLQRVRHRDSRSDKSRALSSPAGVLCYHCGDAVDSDRGKDNAGVTNDRVGGSRVSRPLVQRILLLSPRRALYGCLSRSRETPRPAGMTRASHSVPLVLIPEIFGQLERETRFRRFRKGRDEFEKLRWFCISLYLSCFVCYCCSFYVFLSSKNKLSS